MLGQPEQSRVVDAIPTLALALVVPQHVPLFGYDRLLVDPVGRRLAHRLYLSLAICAEAPALGTDPFVYTLLDARYGNHTRRQTGTERTGIDHGSELVSAQH